MNSIEVSPGNTLICSSSTDGTTIIWDVKTGDILTSLIQPSGAGVRIARFCPQSSLLASAGDDEEVCIWDISTGHLVRKIKEHEATVFALAFSPDGDILVTSDALGRCKVWSSLVAHSQMLTGVEEAHDLGVNSLCFSPSYIKTALATEYQLITCGNDGFVASWKIVIGSRNKIILNTKQFGHDGSAMAVAVSIGGDFVASAGGDKLIKVWTRDLDTCHVLQGHTRYVTSLAFSHCGQFLVSGSNDKSIKVWALADSSEANIGEVNTTSSRGFETRSENLYQIQLSKTKQKQFQVLSGHTLDVTSCDMFQNLIVSGSNDSLIRLWRYSETNYNFMMENISPFRGHNYSVYCVKFSHNGAMVVSAGLDGLVLVWNVQTGEILNRFSHEESIAFRVCDVSVNDAYVGAGADDNILHLWSLESGAKNELLWHENTVFAVSFTQDCQYVASGCSGGSLAIWSVKDSPCLIVSVNDGHDLGVTSCKFQFDDLLVSVGHDGEIKFWSFNASKKILICEQVIQGHPTSIMNLWISNTGARNICVTSSGDKTCKVWNTETMKCLATLGPHSSYVTAGAMDCRNNILAVCVDKIIILYKITSIDPGAVGGDTPPVVPVSASQICSDISTWNSDDVRTWLETLNLTDDAGVENMSDIDGATLENFQIEDLVALGIQEHSASRIYDEIKLICDKNEEIPSEFICPITCDMMRCPVKCSDGFIYEETAIKVKTGENCTKIVKCDPICCPVAGMVIDAEKHFTHDQLGDGKHKLGIL